MPKKPATAPRNPRKRVPRHTARFTTFAPGMNWQNANRSANSASSSHLRSSTTMRRANGSVPPKPVALALKKAEKICQQVGICSSGSPASPEAEGGEAGAEDTEQGGAKG